MGRNFADFSGSNNPNYKTGLAVTGNRNSLYNSWQGMKQRCLNPNNPKYYRYGGRGIKICEEWLNIQGFMKWAFENGWKQGLTIDRTDNDGDYCPKNCCWVSVYDNSRKKSNTKITNEIAEIIRERRKEGIKSLAKEYGCSEWTISNILTYRRHLADGEDTKMRKHIA